MRIGQKFTDSRNGSQHEVARIVPHGVKVMVDGELKFINHLFISNRRTRLVRDPQQYDENYSADVNRLAWGLDLPHATIENLVAR